MKNILAAMMLFALVNPVASGQTGALPRISADQVVTQGTPSDINITPQVAGPDSCYAIFSSFSDGTPQLIAAVYTNGVFGHLLMLSVDSSSLQVSVLADITKPQYLLGGAGCDLEIVNLAPTSAGSPLSQVLQLDLPGLSGQGSGTWFFEWDGSKFINLTPIEADYNLPPDTVLFNAWPVDVEHSGVKQIISVGDADLFPGPDGITVIPRQLWKFDGTSFVPEKTLAEFAEFTREKGNPPPVLMDVTQDTCYGTVCKVFAVRNLAAQYKLTLVNGNADGSLRCSSGYIILNNVIVISPDDLNQNVEFITKTVTLQTQNTLYATLASSPGNTVTITIEPQP